MKLFSKFSILNSQFSTPQRGLPANASLKRCQAGASTIYIVIIIVIIIFAVMFSGGTEHLLSGGTASIVTNTPTPPAGSTPTSSPTPTADPAWTIDVSLTACQQGKSPFKTANITAKGQNAGYIVLEIETSPGNWIQDSSASFAAPSQNFTADLPNDAGYNSKNWRLRLFSGGTQTGDSWSGGSFRTSYAGSATGC